MKMWKVWAISGFLLAQCAGMAWSQDADLPLQHGLYHYIDRLDIKGQTGNTIHTSFKPYSREMVSEIFSNTSGTSDLGARNEEWHRLMQLTGDDEFANEEEGKGILKTLYRNKRDFYALNKDKVRIYANPIVNINAGGDQHNYTTDLSTLNLLNYRNSRGVQVRGTAFDKLGFYTEVSENQLKAPQYVRNMQSELSVLPGENFVKVFDAQSDNPGFDYFSARGYITYSPAKQLRIKFGKDRAFFGDGYQSLMLSDVATDHLFLNINTRIWKFQYINHFAQMTDFVVGKPDSYGTYPKKYAVFHQLFYKPSPGVSVGLFESVVYSPTLPGGQRGFELEYLNPIIFYRSVEQSLGSPDNSLLGLSWKINFLKRFQNYGQILLDDLNFRNRAQGVGYWGNKYGWQMGLKYVDAFWIPRLDLQLEYNRVRPYTYSHFNPTANYSNYGQYLAHGRGSNLYDFNMILRYQPFPRWNAMLVFTSMLKGHDLNGDNYGGNIFRPYTQRVQDYNNTVGQGDAFRVKMIYGRLSYRLFNLDAYVDIEGQYRTENENKSIGILGALRVNLPNRPWRF